MCRGTRPLRAAGRNHTCVRHESTLSTREVPPSADPHRSLVTSQTRVSRPPRGPTSTRFPLLRHNTQSRVLGPGPRPLYYSVGTTHRPHLPRSSFLQSRLRSSHLTSTWKSSIWTVNTPPADSQVTLPPSPYPHPSSPGPPRCKTLQLSLTRSPTLSSRRWFSFLPLTLVTPPGREIRTTETPEGSPL